MPANEVSRKANQRGVNPTVRAESKHVVGLDVETTSLDPSSGDIIEIAAIRFDLSNGQEVNRYVALTKPTSPISDEITAITGITQSMVQDQEPFAAHVDKLREFIGDDIILAHNAPFDLGFLAAHGLKLNNPAWDTFPLASIALPEAASYNLGQLAQHFNIKLTSEHRAAEDVALTWQLLLHLKSQLRFSAVDLAIVKAVLTKASLQHYQPLFSVRQATKAKAATTRKSVSGTNQTNSLEEIFANGGLLTAVLDNYIARPEQLRVAKAVEQAINEQTTVLIEAGTGIGKTLAYAAPAIVASQDKQIVISTYTKHLQDQIIGSDLPTLLRAMQVERTIAVLKGRRNYVCQERLKQLLNRPSLNPSQALALIKVLHWLNREPGDTTVSGLRGDLTRLNISHHDQGIFRQLHADAVLCRDKCSARSGCPYQQAKAGARRANLVIVNHALLIQSALGEESGVVAQATIIDEAHHLAAAARDAAMIDFSLERVKDILGSYQRLARNIASTQSKHLTKECRELVKQYEQLLLVAGQLVARRGQMSRLSLTPAFRRSTDWQKFSQLISAVRSRLKFSGGLAKSLADNLAEPEAMALAETRREAEQLAIELEQFADGSPERIQWLESDWTAMMTPAAEPSPGILQDTALSVAAVLAPLMTSEQGIVLTSATLTANQSFEYTKRQLGITNADEYVMSSAYDLKAQMLINIIEDGPDPRSDSYDNFIAQQTVQIANTLQGRVLCLLTSKKSVRYVYEYAIKELNKGKIKVLAQGHTGGRTNMLIRFKQAPNSILIGTDSFWEGIDIPGQSLSCVIIGKLPFSPPDDPIMKAVAQAEGISAFSDLALPTMIIKLRQGIGRLIRAESDKGAVVILDPRVNAAPYGDTILRSLPPGTIKFSEAARLDELLTDWFGPDQLHKWQLEAETQDT